MLRLAAFVTVLALASAVPAQAPTDAVVDQVLAVWKDARKRSLDGKPDPAAARAVGDLDIRELMPAQLERLCAVMLPQTADAELKGRCRARLQAIAAGKDADGAVAAARVVELVERKDRDAPKEEQQEYQRQRLAALRAAATHPGLAVAIGEGRATSLFLQTYFQRDAKALADAGVIAALLPLVTDRWPAARVRDLLAFQETASEPGGGLDAKARERLRTAALAVTERALTDQELPARERKYLEGRCEHLRGKAALGKLLGEPAPQVDFLWCNRDPAPESLADLRGKIVVADFWATWCVPCVGTFPHLRELVERYRGLPVVIVGITSLQGFVSYPKATDPRQKRVETKEATDELARLGPWCKEMEVTWTAVVSRQDCFNPDFGIRSIPHVAILDAKGNVRWNGVAGKDIESRIDELLTEMGQKPPARRQEGDR